MEEKPSTWFRNFLLCSCQDIPSTHLRFASTFFMARAVRLPSASSWSSSHAVSVCTVRDACAVSARAASPLLITRVRCAAASSAVWQKVSSKRQGYSHTIAVDQYPESTCFVTQPWLVTPEVASAASLSRTRTISGPWWVFAQALSISQKTSSLACGQRALIRGHICSTVDNPRFGNDEYIKEAGIFTPVSTKFTP